MRGPALGGLGPGWAWGAVEGGEVFDAVSDCHLGNDSSPSEFIQFQMSEFSLCLIQS